MNALLQRIRARLTATSQSVRAFYAANRVVVLSGLTALSILLIVWARLGFTLQVSKFYAGGTCSAANTTAECAAGCSGSQHPGDTQPDTLGCTGGTTCCVNKPSGMSQALWSAADGRWFTAGLYEPSCPANFPYHTDRSKPDGSQFSIPEACVEKPQDCPDGYQAQGGSKCITNQPAPTATPAPTAAPPAGTPLPAQLSVVCGATQNVLTWATPLPAGSNASAINKTTTPPGGAPTSIQIGIDLSTNPSSYTDTAVQTGYTYGYDFKNHVSVRSNYVTCPSANATPAGTPDPNAPPAGEIRGACTGGATPQITLRWSKLPPPGTTIPVNSNGMNRTEDGVATQLQYLVPVDKGQYWEFGDTQVKSNSVYSYRAKYAPSVATSNTYNVTASPANCGAVAVVTPTVSCAPASQTVIINQAANLQGSGGDGTFQFISEGQIKTGSAVSFTYGEVGTKQVTVRSGGQSAVCTVIVQGQAVTADVIALAVNGRNVSTGGAEGPLVTASGNQQIEVIIAATNAKSGDILRNLTVQAALPAGFSYVAGSTSVNGTATTADSIAAGGLSGGALGPGQSVTFRFRALVNGASFPAGQSQTTVNILVTADGAAPKSGQLTVIIGRATGRVAGVRTGPGDAVFAALLVSAIMTLLYVSYTHTSVFRRHEVDAITKEGDPMDFRS